MLRRAGLLWVICAAALAHSAVAEGGPQRKIDLSFTITGENCRSGQGCVHLKPQQFYIQADLIDDGHIVQHGPEGQLSVLHMGEWGTLSGDAAKMRYRVAKSGIRIDYAQPDYAKPDYAFSVTLQAGESCFLALAQLQVEAVNFRGHLSDVTCHPEK